MEPLRRSLIPRRPRRTASVCATLALAGLLAVAGRTLAQPAAVAEQLFQQGQALMEEGRLEEACTKLAASMQAEASPGTALNLARCNELRGKTATAWAGFKQAAALFRARGDPERERFARDRATELEPRLSKLVIEPPVTPITGLVVRQDGVEVPRAALGMAMPVDAGEHAIDMEAPRHERWSTTIAVGADGDFQRIELPALRPLPAAPSAPPDAPADTAAEAADPNGLVVGGGVLLGIGAAALAVGSVVGALVLGDASEAEQDESLCGADQLCTAEGLERIESAESKAIAADVLLGVGAALAVGGLVVLLVGTAHEDGASAARSATHAWVAPAGRGWGIVLGLDATW